MNKTKKCSTCKQTKSLTEFYKSKERHDGIQGRCKPCMNKIIGAYMKTQAGKATQKRYYTSEKGKNSRRKAAIKYKRKNTKKVRARDALNKAVKRGELSKASSHQCVLCPKQAEVYHHIFGYELKYRMDVLPLCRRCHGAVHALFPS